MKTKLYIKTAFVALVSMASLSSCLKDDKHYVDFAGAVPLVELPAATPVGSSGGILQAVGLDISATPVPINLMVNLAAPHTLSTNLTVKVSVDQAALTKYNKDNGTNLELLPATDYSSNFTATIPASKNSAYVVINVKSNLIDPSKTNYALPLTITDGGGQQISNYKTVIYNVQVKNAYDGDYSATGTISFPDPSSNRGWTNRAKTLKTINANTVSAEPADLGGNGFAMYLTVAADGTTVNVAPAPSSANQTIQGNGTNTYDAATKTFSLHYKYVGGTGDRIIVETIKKK